MSAAQDDTGRAWSAFTLVALMVAVTLAFLDRQVLNLVVDPIRAEMKISDTQFSLLQGAAFTLVYTFVMLPIAWGADRFNRKWIVVGSVVAWSVMTIAFGLAEGFAALLLARAGVALGEAGLSPAATSIVRDGFPRDRQATALAIVTSGVYAGGAISMAGGGPALAWLTHLAQTQGLPLGLAPWRWLFIGAGAIGMVGVVLLLFIREPLRHRRPTDSASWGEYLRLMGTIRSATAAYVLAFIGFYLLSAAFAAWLPAMFMRNHAWSPQAVGLSFGVINLGAGVLGALNAGWVVDTLGRRGDPKAQLRVVRVGFICVAAGSALSALAPNPYLGLAGSFVAHVGGGICISLGTLGFQAMYPARFSARAVATYLLCTGVLGAALGPTVVPLIAALFGDGGDLAHALGFWAVVAGAWSVAWLSWAIARPPGSSSVADA